MKITIIGTGRAGRSFATALRDVGHDVTARHHDDLLVDPGTDLVLLCVPDDALSDVGDPCMATPGKDHYGCAMDSKSLLKCDGQKFVQSDTCLGKKTCKLQNDVFGCFL